MLKPTRIWTFICEAGKLTLVMRQAGEEFHAVCRPAGPFAGRVPQRT